MTLDVNTENFNIKENTKVGNIAKYSAMTVGIIAGILANFNIFPVYMFFFLVMHIGWIVFAITIDEPSIWITNLVSVFFVVIGLIKLFLI